MSRRKGRRLAVQALYSWDVGNTDAEVLATFPWYDSKSGNGIDGTLDFPRLILQGTLENITEIDDLIRKHLEHWDMDRLARVDLAILRMGTYSLLYQPAIPAQVTIDEAVELAKELSTDEAYRFINGVLDGVRRRVQDREDD